MFIPREIAQNVAMMFGPIRRMAQRHHLTGLVNDTELSRKAFQKFAECASPSDRDVLEIGPGQTTLVLQYALEAGARSATGLDVTDYLRGAPPRGMRFCTYDGGCRSTTDHSTLSGPIRVLST
jgi:hypothetical protein